MGGSPSGRRVSGRKAQVKKATEKALADFENTRAEIRRLVAEQSNVRDRAIKLRLEAEISAKVLQAMRLNARIERGSRLGTTLNFSSKSAARRFLVQGPREVEKHLQGPR